MSLGLSSKPAFDLATGFASNPSLSAANSASAPKQTILQAALPNMNVKPVTAPPAVDATKPGAAAAAQAGQKACASAHQENAQTLAAVGEGVKAMQGEIAAACKANGSSAGAVFPNTQGPQSVAEIGVDALSTAGGGSMATFQAASTIAMVGDIAADRTSSPEAIMTKVADTLRASCHDNQQNTGLIQNADAAPDMGQSSFDWEAILEAGDLKDIMYCNPEDPQSIGKAFPELHALHDAQAGIKEAGKGMDGIVKNAQEPPYNADGIAFAKELPPAQVIVANGGADMPHVTAFDHTGAAVALGGKPAAGNSLETAAMKQSLAANFDSAPAMQDTMGA
ncbi:MAG: hypothetical protein ACRBCT_00535 [Alphaproteobacteria bacterium]